MRMKKIFKFIILASLAISVKFAFAANPMRYVQISTNAVTKQTGSFNVTSGTSTDMGITRIVGTGTTISSMTATNFKSTRSTITYISGGLGNNIVGNSKMFTGLAAGTTAGHSVRYEQLKVLQVLQYTVATASASTAIAFKPTHLSGAITPSSTASKILVIGDASMSVSAIQTGGYLTLLRGSTNLGDTNGMCVVLSGGGTITGDTLHVPCTMVFLDSPGTVASTTYKVGFRSGATSSTVRINHLANTTATLTLIEINGL
jgi:hypothetical protein